MSPVWWWWVDGWRERFRVILWILWMSKNIQSGIKIEKNPIPYPAVKEWWLLPVNSKHTKMLSGLCEAAWIQCDKELCTHSHLIASSITCKNWIKVLGICNTWEDVPGSAGAGTSCKRARGTASSCWFAAIYEASHCFGKHLCIVCSLNPSWIVLQICLVFNMSWKSGQYTMCS